MYILYTCISLKPYIYIHSHMIDTSPLPPYQCVKPRNDSIYETLTDCEESFSPHVPSLDVQAPPSPLTLPNAGDYSHVCVYIYDICISITKYIYSYKHLPSIALFLYISLYIHIRFFKHKRISSKSIQKVPRFLSNF